MAHAPAQASAAARAPQALTSTSTGVGLVLVDRSAKVGSVVLGALGEDPNGAGQRLVRRRRGVDSDAGG